jgi:hypothetical protein
MFIEQPLSSIQKEAATYIDKKITPKFPSIEGNIVKSQSKAIKIKKTKREMEEQIKLGADSFDTSNGAA